MRYLLATSDLPPRRGGVARYHAAVIRALAQHGAVHLVSLDRHWLWLLWELPRALRAQRTSALIIGEILPIGTVAWMLWVAFRIPYVIICHGLDLQNAQHVPRRRWLAQRILWGAHWVIANSRRTAAIAEAVGAAPTRLQVIPPCIGITPEFTRPAQSPDVRRISKLDHSRIVLSVGRLIPRKGFDTLVEAMGVVQRSHPRAVLVVIGDGPERERLEQLAQARRVSVRFLGPLDDATTAAWYDACDVFAMLPRELPDGDIEGFGIVYAEAGAFGKPVVGTRSGGVEDAVVDGETGLLVPPTDPTSVAAAIARLLSDHGLAERLGRAGAARAAAEFSFEKFAERIRTALT